MTLRNHKNEVRFALSDDSLLVANTGTPFSRLGVISICAAHLSAKRRRAPVDDFAASDEGLVEAILDRELETYRNDPNRLTSDYAAKTRSEETTRAELSGRSFRTQTIRWLPRGPTALG